MNMRQACLSIAAALLLAAAAPAAAQDEAALVQKYKLTGATILKAQKFLDQGKPDKCEAELRSCFAAVPDHHAALYVKAQSLYKAGDYAAALAAMEEAKAGYHRLDAAMKKMQTIKLEEAMATVQSLVDAQPDLETRAAQTQCKVGIYNGDVMYAQGRINQKVEDLKQGLVMATASSPAEYEYFTGNCLFKLNRLDEAEIAYRAAVESAPDHANAYTNLIGILYGKRSLAEAKAFLALAEANKAKVHPGLKKAVLEAAK
jgi:tetratricopeptide (TPR) repeat protein